MTEHGHNTQQTEAQTEDNNQFADPDDFKVQRDSSGELLPQVQETKLGRVKVIPMAYGDIEDYFGDAEVADIGAGQLARMLQDHVVEPNLAADAGGQITAEYVKDLKPLAPRELIFAILDASGIDADVEMQEGGGAEVAVGN